MVYQFVCECLLCRPAPTIRFEIDLCGFRDCGFLNLPIRVLYLFSVSPCIHNVVWNQFMCCFYWLCLNLNCNLFELSIAVRTLCGWEISCRYRWSSMHLHLHSRWAASDGTPDVLAQLAFSAYDTCCACVRIPLLCLSSSTACHIISLSSSSSTICLRNPGMFTNAFCW